MESIFSFARSLFAKGDRLIEELENIDFGELCLLIKAWGRRIGVWVVFAAKLVLGIFCLRLWTPLGVFLVTSAAVGASSKVLFNDVEKRLDRLWLKLTRKVADGASQMIDRMMDKLSGLFSPAA